MDLFKGDSESTVPVTPPVSASRRTFLGRLMGGLAIAVPAVRVLASAPSAAAKSSAIPNINPCSKVYLVILDTWCSTGQAGCPSGSAGTCSQEIEERSATTGQSCGSYIRQVGRCGTNSCVPAAAGAQPDHC
jgi:hypothetical protein